MAWQERRNIPFDELPRVDEEKSQPVAVASGGLRAADESRYHFRSHE